MVTFLFSNCRKYGIKSYEVFMFDEKKYLKFVRTNIEEDRGKRLHRYDVCG